ncbi:MAG: ATP-binding protein [Hamadaea sp.]|uniref:ATP-binding protein n=1 Tax=Hamadaea sp. TaxID=2024425 RepID=UPI0018520216|nr:ATP-binding protein [Hamadaea sp.]NUR69298.1 ATP-binding protein [Hamadaea sp.]NUT21998.1 ATP-binding protein [Hamadaea sp.]
MTRQDLRTGVYELRPTGSLDLSGTAALRRSALKVLPEQPRALLLGLDEIDIRDPLNLAVLPSIDKRVRLDCGIRLQCYADPATDTGRRVRQVVGGRIALHDDRLSALVAADQETVATQRAYRHLTPGAGAVREARAITQECCRRWGIPQISDAAQLIVSELITNAVQHAQTEIDLILTHRGPRLHLQVRDTAYAPALFPIEPVSSLIYRVGDDRIGGRGLMLVAMLSAACGTTVGADAKTVWASLRVRPEV